MTESSIVELFGYIMWCSQWIDKVYSVIQGMSLGGHDWIYQVQNELILIWMFKFWIELLTYYTAAA